MLIYVNWNRKQIMSEDEFVNTIMTANENREFDNDFDDYLNECFSTIEVFEFDEVDKERVRKEFLEDLISYLMDNGFDGFEPYNI